MSFVKRATGAAVSLLKREPVAVWGVVAAAALGLVASLTGHDVSAVVDVVLPLVGIPVVRRKVTPTDALKALAKGARRPRGNAGAVTAGDALSLALLALVVVVILRLLHAL